MLPPQKNGQTLLIECKMSEDDIGQALHQLMRYSNGFFEHARLMFAYPYRITAKGRRNYYEWFKKAKVLMDNFDETKSVSIFPTQLIYRFMGNEVDKLLLYENNRISKTDAEDQIIQKYSSRELLADRTKLERLQRNYK